MKKSMVHGTSLDMVDNTGMNLHDKIEFNTDGTYRLTLYVYKDSVFSQTTGTFHIDPKNSELKTTTNSFCVYNKIISIKNGILKLETTEGKTLRMKKIL